MEVARPAVALVVGSLIVGAVVVDATLSGTTSERRYMMGTEILVEAYGGSEPQRRETVAQAFGAFSEVDRVMSDYRTDSELSQLNAKSGSGPVRVGEPLFAVIDAARRVSEASGGAFDITIGPAMAAWGFKTKKPRVPPERELAALRTVVGFSKVRLNAKARTVSLPKGASIDLGGIAKGFAVELASSALRAHQLNGFIDAGGNQYLLGSPERGTRDWTIGIKDPDSPSRVLGSLTLPGGFSVSTSSQRANFLEYQGRRYGHILDPRTLTPAETALSVTVIARDATIGDALSKAAFLLPVDAALRVVQSFNPGGQDAGVVIFRRGPAGIDVALSPWLTPRFTRSRP